MTTARTAYRENDIHGATAVKLVVLLYEQLIHDLNQAAEAIEQNQIEVRTKRINHAILVIGYLQSALDFASGGKVAKDLENFYNVLRQELVQVQFQPSGKGIRQQITDVLAVREAWIEVERSERPAVPCSTVVSAISSTGPDTAPARKNWEG
jgi:flagellar protein FliS